MDIKEILLEVSQRYSELVVLVRRLIATKVEDVAAISQLQTALNDKNEEVSSLLQQNTETAAIASTISNDLASLISEASAAIPGDEVPSEPTDPNAPAAPEVPSEPEAPVTDGDAAVNETQVSETAAAVDDTASAVEADIERA
jgi:hypothetical protein